MNGKEKIKYLVRRKSIKFSLLALVALLAISGMYMVALANQVTGLTVTPDPIKLGSSAYLQYTLGQDANVTIQVYNGNGELVKTLLNNVFRYAGSYTQSWNGTDQTGAIVPNGSYKFVVEAKDNSGAQVGYAEKTCVAAQVPQITNVTDTPDPFNPLAGEKSTIQYTISAVASVEITITKNYLTIRNFITTQELKAPGTYTFSWDGRDNDGKVVDDGAYTYQIVALSASGSTTFKGTTNVEKEAPRVTGLTAMPDPLKLSSSSLNIMYSLSENAKVTMKIVDSSGNTVREILNGVSKNAGYNSSSWDGKNAAGDYVPEGMYSVVVSAVDSYGNSSGNQTVNFKAGYLPAVSNLAISPATFDPTNGTANISYNISKDALVTVQVLNGYNPVRTLLDKRSQAAGAHSIEWDGKDDSGKMVGDGNYTVQITAVSSVVEIFSGTAKGTVTVEKGAPSVTELSLGPNPYKLGSGSNLAIMYNLSENSVVTINVLKGTEIVRNLVVSQPKTAGFNSTAWDGKDNTGNVVGEGTYTVVVKAADSTGNTGEASANVTAGYQPSISNISVAPNPYNLSGNVNFSFDLTKSAKVTLSIMKGTLPVRTISAGTLGSGANTVVWDGKDDNGAMVSDGSYNYRIDAVSPVVDIFKSTAQGTLTVEGSGPAIIDLGVSPFIVKIGSNATFRYTLTEAAVVSAQIVTKTGAVVRDFLTQTKTAGGFFSLVWDTRDNQNNLISSGEYVFKITATDSSNNSSSAELAFQAGAVPVVSSVYADPATVNVTSRGGQTTIFFNLSEKSNVTAKVIDASGKTVRLLYAYQQLDAGTQSAVWDCKNDQGRIVGGGAYTVLIDAFSAIGNYKAVQASCTVNVTGAVGGDSGCTDCHTSYPATHQMDSCAGCHGGNEPISSIHGGDLDCAECHGPHDSTQLAAYDCAFCHNSTYSDKIPAHPADLTAPHISTTFDTANCGTCHQSDVTKVHTQCTTCHTSAKDIVIGAIATGNTQCATCHRQQHNVNFAETVPDDIPLYTAVSGGMTWTPPRDAFLWAGESWMPDEFLNGGKVVMSDRHTDISGEAVYNFYTTEMAANGWTVEPHAQVVSDFFTLTFTKEGRKAVVWFYGGEKHNSSPVVESGYKIDILYK